MHQNSDLKIPNLVTLFGISEVLLRFVALIFDVGL